MNQPAGWCADPFNREQERYWDGKVWTAHVRPPGAAHDAPPPGFETAVPTVTSTHRPGPAYATPAGGASPTATAWSPGAHAMPASAPPPHRRAMVLSAIAAAVLVVGGVGAYLVLGDHGSAAGSEAIANAVTQSLSEQTADMSLDVQISAAGMNEHVTGNGAFDFTTHSGTITVNVPAGDEQISEQVIEDSSTVYVSMPSQFAAIATR